MPMLPPAPPLFSTTTEPTSCSVIASAMKRAMMSDGPPGVLATTIPAGPRPAAALDYPTGTVRVIIPFTAGAAPDVLLRLVAQALQDKWGQAVVVENRAGGNTLVGTVAAAKSAPDGATLLLAADQTFVLNP